MRASSMQRLEIAADEARLCEVRDFVDAACGVAGFTPRAAANIRLAVDEACTNVIKHAYADSSGGTLSIACGSRGRWFEIRILDRGAAFEGRIDMQQLGTLVETKRKGGLGVFLMHRLMDDVQYQTTPGGNEWILRKRLPQQASTLTQRWRRRWAWRAGLALVGVSAIAVTPLWLQIGRQRDGVEMHALRTHAAALAEAARPVLVHRAELTPEQTHLLEVVYALARQESRLLSIDVVDAEGTIWAADRAAATFTHYTAPGGLGAADAAGVRAERTRIDGTPVVHLAMPVRVGDEGRAIGMVHLAMRWDGVASGIASARGRLVTAAALLDLLLFGLIAAAFTAFLRPLQRLVDGVRGLSQDDRALAEDGPAEIGAIAQAFNEIHARYRAAAVNAAEHERLQQEMRLAHDIQAAILPQELPQIPGYEIARLYKPAAEVGGDYYDFLDAGAGLTGVVVADVAGKGVPGSMVMGMIRTALRMETRRNANAGDVLARLHQFLAADMRNGMFVTMLYVVLDTRHRVVSYASAGHTPMILYRAATDETFCLATRGLPVGLVGSDAAQFEAQLDVERLRLRKGDLLLLYTDGVTEARNAAGEGYGEARLVQAVQRWGRESASEFTRRLEDDVREFTGGAPPQDDLTVVVIKEMQESPLYEGELQRKLIDLVEQQGIPVAEACRRLKVSPSTYYRLRHAGADAATQLPVDKRAALLRLVQSAPQWNAGALALALGDTVGSSIEPSRVEGELRRLGLEDEPARRAYAQSPAAQASHALDGVLPASSASSELVVIESSLDSGSCDALEARLAEASRHASLVVVDLAAAAYISSRAWGLLAQAAARLRPHGRLALVAMRPDVHDIYRALRFDSVLPAYPDRETASNAAAPAALQNAAVPASAPIPAASPVHSPGASIGGATPIPDAVECESLRLRVGAAAPGVVLLALEGILDTVTAQSLEPELRRLGHGNLQRALADLSRVEFISSAGWGGLVALATSLRDAGGGLRVFGMPPAVQRIHALLHLESVLPSHDELASALAALGVEGVAAPVAVAAAPEPDSFQGESLRGRAEAWGTSGRALRILLRGSATEADREPFAAWLAERTVAHEWTLVDARALDAAATAAWSVLAWAGDHGVRFAVIGDPRQSRHGFVVHAQVADALRARRAPIGLRSIDGDSDSLARDVSVRSEGWDAYLRLLRQTDTEVHS